VAAKKFDVICRNLNSDTSAPGTISRTDGEAFCQSHSAEIECFLRLRMRGIFDFGDFRILAVRVTIDMVSIKMFMR
jgi:hypothetical protein